MTDLGKLWSKKKKNQDSVKKGKTPKRKEAYVAKKKKQNYGRKP